MTNKQRDALNRFRQALRPFIEMDGAMTLNRLETLLAVYCEGFNDMQSLREYTDKEYKLSKSALSRMVSWWGDEAYLQFKNDDDGKATKGYRPEGMGFLRFDPDPMDYRRRTITVTPKGERFGSELADRIMDNARNFFNAHEPETNALEGFSANNIGDDD